KGSSTHEIEAENSDIPFAKTPVGSCVISLLTLAIISTVCLSTLFVLWILVWWPIEDYLFIKKNASIVQEAIIEQCSIPDYQLEGRFDDSSVYRYYYDFYDTLELRIDCRFNGSPRNWNCTCEHTAND